MAERFDHDRFEERAAIMEFDGGRSRFAAETDAAAEQGLARWQALQLVKEATNANGNRHSAGSRYTDTALAGQPRTNDMPRMQRRTAKENRPMPQHYADGGRGGLVLPALWAQGRGVL